MDTDFTKVKPEKQRALINSGLSEFAAQGYKRSSLNTILLNAKASKGFFYHYFKNKESFYMFLVHFGINQVVDKLNKEKILEERDYIKRLQVQAIYKIEISKDYPKLFDFLASYYKTVTREEYMALVGKMSGDFINRFLTENIDYSLFRDDIPRDIALKVVGRYSAQIQHELELQEHLTDFKDVIMYYKTQLEDIRHIVYKKGN